jgi:hypothetical protein
MTDTTIDGLLILANVASAAAAGASGRSAWFNGIMPGV